MRTRATRSLVCIECDSNFEARRSDAKFCSSKCKSRHKSRDSKTKCDVRRCGRIAVAGGQCQTHRARKNRGELDWDRPIKKQNRVRCGLKYCIGCDKTKGADEFYSTGRRGTLSPRCRECSKPLNRERKVNNPAQRDYQLRQKYGIDSEQYDQMFADQNGMCAICGNTSKKRLCVDHNHDTGEVRKLLCNKCNAGLGQFCDDAALLDRAAEYIRSCL